MCNDRAVAKKDGKIRVVDNHHSNRSQFHKGDKPSLVLRSESSIPRSLCSSFGRISSVFPNMDGHQ